MTCIVGLVHEGEVWMGGDRCVTWGSSGRQAADTQPKIARIGNMLIGAAGESNASDLVFWTESLSTFDGGDAKKYLLRQVVPWLRSVAEDKGRMEVRDGRKILPWCLLFGIGGRLFDCDDGGDVCEPTPGYWSLGLGGHTAVGSLHTTARTRLAPRRRLYLALKAASDLTDSVGPPFDIVRL